MEKNYKLNDVGNRKPFSVPNDYFEQFATQFEEQICLKPVSPIKLLRPWMFMAAMFLGVFFLSKIAYSVYADSKLTKSENYELYVMSQVDDVENMELYDQVQNNE